jgi:FKBP-type peptidyl-prolyl cis-trans isomerase
MSENPFRSLVAPVLFGAALLVLAFAVRFGWFASKNPGEPINSAMRAALSRERPELSTSDSMLIDKLYPTATVTASGLRFVVRAPGSGPSPRAGDEVTADYAGRFLDGTTFDSSYKRGVPFTFRVGMGQVIKGWDEAFLTMKRGEKRTLIIPYWLAYGVKGQPPSIPPKQTLVFEVQLWDFH